MRSSRRSSPRSTPEKLADDLYAGALDLLGCMCSGLDLTNVVTPLLEMVLPAIAEVETDDSLSKLSLYQIIHKAQTAVSGFMAPTLLCSTSCKSSAGNVLHLAFEAARFFLSDANETRVDLVDLPTPVPAAPRRPQRRRRRVNRLPVRGVGQPRRLPRADQGRAQDVHPRRADWRAAAVLRRQG